MSSNNTRGRDGPAIEVSGVRFSYGKTRALNGLDLAVPHGLSFGLLGPNGAGKSTLIRLVVGLANPQQGRVQVLGQPPARVIQRLGYMPQAPALYQELSARENVDFFARVFGLSNPSTRRARVDAALEQMDLSDVADRQVYKLSGGMRQRASLACALAHEPEVMVLDEPTVGLDPRLRASLWDLFHELTAAGRTLLVSSHTMDDAAHCQRLAFMRAGRIIATGAPSELQRAAGEDGATLEGAFLHFASAEDEADEMG